MAEDEDEDESKASTFEEIMESVKEERSERREEVSYRWVETIREAGELYRGNEDIETVSNKLDIHDQEIREALTVYRLIFEDPPEEVASKSSTAGRYYFSLEEDDEEGLAKDEEEPIEDLVREYVGALYLQRTITDEPVGDPPERTMPPLAFDITDLTEEFGDDFTPAINAMLEASTPRITDILGDFEGFTVSDFMSTYPTRTIGDMVPSTVAQQGLLTEGVIESINTQHKEVIQSAISANLPSLFDHIQHQDLMSVSIANSVGNIQFPESIVADLASIQTSVNTTATDESTPATSDTEDSRTTETPTTTEETDSTEVTTTPIPETGPEGVTLDATLPDSDAFTTELVFEIPAMIVESILSTGQARAWFTSLSNDYQISAIRILLAAIAFQLTANLGMASLAALLAPAVRKAIIGE